MPGILPNPVLHFGTLTDKGMFAVSLHADICSNRRL